MSVFIGLAILGTVVFCSGVFLFILLLTLESLFLRDRTPRLTGWLLARLHPTQEHAVHARRWHFRH